MDAHEFLKLGNVYTKSSLTKSRSTAFRRFMSFFGITPLVCSIVWDKIQHEAPEGSHRKHLLWCLSFLKEYSHEHYRRSIFNADEKTIRKWTWIFVKLLSDLDVIRIEARFDSAANGQTCFCSIDGVDFAIFEPTPFNPGYFSHKIHAAGLRYEVSLNIRTGHIVWVNGGYPCGQYPDLVLAREAFVLHLRDGEKVLADKGYQDQNYFLLKNQQNSELHGTIMARHETVNKRLKQFEILNQRFRNSLHKHPMVFHACANVTQLMIVNGHPLFHV